MYTKLPSGTKAVIEKPSSGSSQLGLVVIPDVMGLRPLFEDMVKNLSNEWKMPVCSFELYPDLEHLNVEERLAAASELERLFLWDDPSARSMEIDESIRTDFLFKGRRCFFRFSHRWK